MKRKFSLAVILELLILHCNNQADTVNPLRIGADICLEIFLALSVQMTSDTDELKTSVLG